MSAGPATLEALAEDQYFDDQIALVREHWRSCRRLWLDTEDPLRVARLGPNLPHDFWMTAGLPGLAPVRPVRNGRFEFTEGGRPAVIIPAYDGLPGLLNANAERHVEALVDLVAVDVDHPDRFWRRRGEALVLGSAYLEIAGGLEAEPIPVFKNPLTWLRSAGAGVVVLDWDWVPDLLLGCDLIAEDVDLGNQLEAALKPEIWVMRAAA